MGGKQKVKRKQNFWLYNKQWRERNRKQRRNIERIPKVLCKVAQLRPSENLQEENKQKKR